MPKLTEKLNKLKEIDNREGNELLVYLKSKRKGFS